MSGAPTPSSREFDLVLNQIEVNHKDTKADIARLEGQIQGIIARLDARLQQEAHDALPQRVAFIERRLDGLWGKVLGLVGLVTSVLFGLYHLIRGGH